MEAKQILDLLLESGQELIDQGKVLAEKKLNIPNDPAARKDMVDGASKGALAAGAMALLLGTGVGRKLTGAGLKLGSLAAIGSIAFNTFQKWKSQQLEPSVEPGLPINELSGDAENLRGMVLLKAMIAAAKADGSVDEKEKSLISEHLAKLNLTDSANFLLEEVLKPLDAKAVAAGADSPATAAEIYLVSLATVKMINEQERNYLNQLAIELKLAPELAAQLEQSVKL